MTRNPFAPGLEDMPACIPVFPLPGVLLLPGGKLPLNIFEPRYLAMTQDALCTDRLIGMIQPQEEGDSSLHRTGCVGRITSFSETEDGRFTITLTGVARFHVEQELECRSGYRRVVADWCSFADDFNSRDDLSLDRDRLMRGLKDYFALQGIRADWDSIEKAEDRQLLTTLAMVCPFGSLEKQALLEAPTLQERGETMLTLLEMSLHDLKDDHYARH
ncbi:LON peptidase substrate-binding domain-containing protein [uncultured Nisaea sp.]|jgi:uncharacterized protein|uniref:LON peptidase substrate-binding domain-containing protein n=1 Tax=uncultured Nisaea sp. TaxID=538215 RepID=UPI0030EC640D|tara:strand:+ start:3847 stop:4497 length:651 start_codon:yes stop_codon:yes gene_type:complete